MKKITIITICYNEEKKIKRTLDSILCQTYSNYEYIIKDGNSTDGTNEIIAEYKDRFENKGIKFMHLISNDGGIYDAMSIALKQATGEWINFMNAGDSLFNNHVLEDIFQYREWAKQDILYGHTLCELEQGYKFVQINNHNNLINGIGISQQVCFVRKKILDRFSFSKQYKILADYDFLLRAQDANIVFEQLNLIVAHYNRQGISSRNIYETYLERNVILKRYEKNISLNIVKKFILLFKTNFGRFCPLMLDFLFCKHCSKSM